MAFKAMMSDGQDARAAKAIGGGRESNSHSHFGPKDFKSEL